MAKFYKLIFFELRGVEYSVLYNHMNLIRNRDHFNFHEMFTLKLNA